MTFRNILAKAALVAAFFSSAVCAQSPDYIRHPASLPCAAGTFVQTLGATSATQATCATPAGTGVTSVAGTPPIASSGGLTPAISIANAAADGSTKGAATFTAADFDSSSGLISLDYANGQKATTSLPGFLSAADWTTYNGKLTSPLTTKGDLHTYSSTDARLAVGTNNYVLTPDSAQTTGLKWQSLSAQLDAALGSTQGNLIYRNASTWTVLAPAANNSYFLNSQGSGANPTWTIPSSTAGTGWVTAIDCDISAEGSQTFSSNTTYTFCGLTWTKANSSGDRVAMAIVNGSGLVIQPNGGGLTYNGTTRTAPNIYTDLATIIGSSYYIDTPIRIWIYISADNIAADADNAGWFMDNLGTSSTIAQAVAYRSASGGVKANLTGSVFAGASLGTQSAASPLNNTDRVMVTEIPLGFWDNHGTSYSAAYSSGWPALNVLRPIIRGGAVNAQLAVATQDVITSLPMKFGLVALRVNSATLLSVTIARIRIDYRNPG